MEERPLAEAQHFGAKPSDELFAWWKDHRLSRGETVKLHR